jgi:hypothetical protein
MKPPPDTYHLEIALSAEADEIRYSRYVAVIFDYFADHARGIQSAETSEINRRFRMASPFQYPIPAGTKRENVARPCQIATKSGASVLSPVIVGQISRVHEVSRSATAERSRIC